MKFSIEKKETLSCLDILLTFSVVVVNMYVYLITARGVAKKPRRGFQSQAGRMSAEFKQLGLTSGCNPIFFYKQITPTGCDLLNYVDVDHS